MQFQLSKKVYPLLALLAVSGCRTDAPPAQELCALNGLGAGDCVEIDGSQLTRPPSQMVNYVARSPSIEKAYDSWCYDTTPETIEPVMQMMYREARK